MDSENHAMRPAHPLARSPRAIAGGVVMLIAAFFILREHCDLLADRWMFLFLRL